VIIILGLVMLAIRVKSRHYCIIVLFHEHQLWMRRQAGSHLLLAVYAYIFGSQCSLFGVEQVRCRSRMTTNVTFQHCDDELFT